MNSAYSHSTTTPLIPRSGKPTQKTTASSQQPAHIKRNIIAIAILVLVIGVAAISSQSWRNEASNLQMGPTTSQAVGQWKTIRTFTGSANKDTEDFTVQANYWRIVYTAQAPSEPMVFSAFIYPSGETAAYAAFVTLKKPGTTETSYIRAGPGDFWIKIIAGNVNSWTIDVQIQQ